MPTSKAQAPRKLRESCTNCAQSKVKCNKEKPTCGRCSRLTLGCGYMVSRRTGRARHTPSTLAAIVQKPSLGTPVPTQPDSSPMSGLETNPPMQETPPLLPRPSPESSSAVPRSQTRPPGATPVTPLVPVDGAPRLSPAHASGTDSEYNHSGGGGLITPNNPASDVNIGQTSVGSNQSPRSGAGSTSRSNDSPPNAIAEHDHLQHDDPDHIWHLIASPGALMGDMSFSPLMPIDDGAIDLYEAVMSSPMLLDATQSVAVEVQPHGQRQQDQGPLGSQQSTGQDQLVAISSVTGMGGLSTDSSAVDGGRVPGSNTWLAPGCSGCCLSVALQTLGRLFPSADAACKMSRSDEQATTGDLRTIDSVVSENKRVIASVNKLLECQCSEDGYVLAIITLIVLKVLGWYAAAAGGGSSPADDGMQIGWDTHLGPLTAVSGQPAGPTRRGSMSLRMDEQVLHLPTIVGNYCVAGSDQGRMAAQLVLSELHQVQSLVNTLAKRLEAIRSPGGAVDVDIDVDMSLGFASGHSTGSGSDFVSTSATGLPLSSSTFSELEGDLRKRLKAVSVQTIDLLRHA